jgi:DNA-binding LacI/PurR family transcriptional regulator
MPLLDPPITAIKWPYYEMGKKAATVLLENEKYKEKILFETELMIRGSTDTRH